MGSVQASMHVSILPPTLGGVSQQMGKAKTGQQSIEEEDLSQLSDRTGLVPSYPMEARRPRRVIATDCFAPIKDERSI